MIEVINTVSKDVFKENSKKVSLLIHCNAGVGRSGRLAIALILENLIENEKLKESDENINEKIADIILQVVNDRIPSFGYVVYLADHFFKLIDQFLSLEFKKINAPKEKVF